jgi:anaerobic selenocysteine-containing dehydrogenase
MDMFRAFMRGEVKVMWTQTTNPWVSIPNLNRIKREPGDGRFLIVSDIYPTPTTEVADLVLPAAAWVEREGVFGNTERRTQHWHKAADPPGEATEDAWQIIEVARRMGMEHLFPWPEDDWHKPMYEEYRSFTLGLGKDVASYEQLEQTRGMLWPRWRRDPVPVRGGTRPVREEGSGRPLLQGKGIRREGGVLDPPVASAGRRTGRRVPVLAVHGTGAGALAHRLHDPPREAASPGGEGRLRRDEPG